MEYEFFNEFLGFLWKKLSEKEILKNYHICYDVSLPGFEYTVSLISDLDFDLDDRVYLKNPDNLDELLKRYPIDPVIESMISEYCFEKSPLMIYHMENIKDIPVLTRPEITTPCGKAFRINMEDCFLAENGNYYQMCPHCGFLSYVSNSKLSLENQEKIKIRREKDANLERKMILFSELWKLDEYTPNGQKKLVKK